MRLDREEFRLWLATQEPDAIVGKTYDTQGCPAARFLTEQENAPCSVSHRDFASLAERGWVETAPPWLCDFTVRVDHLHPALAPVTAKEALTILDGIA